jgi:hypothetical protein
MSTWREADDSVKNVHLGAKCQDGALAILRIINYGMNMIDY